jgi:type IV pilus assembly protein PilB
MSRKLGEVLISHGVIDSDKLIAALSDQRAFGGKLGRTLVDLGYVSEEQLMAALSEQLGLEVVDLDGEEIPVDALRCVPVDTCERYGVFPVRVDPAQRLLWIATAEPDRNTLQEVAQIAQYTLEPMLASMSSIDRAVRRYYFGEGTSRTRLGEPLRSIPGDTPLAAPAPRSVPNRAEEAELPIGTIVPDGEMRDSVQELKALIIRLERTVNAQSRAFRALVDLLQEKGIVRRGELGQRTSRK